MILALREVLSSRQRTRQVSPIWRGVEAVGVEVGASWRATVGSGGAVCDADGGGRVVSIVTSGGDWVEAKFVEVTTYTTIPTMVPAVTVLYEAVPT